jgi:hypothetical protein
MTPDFNTTIDTQYFTSAHKRVYAPVYDPTTSKVYCYLQKDSDSSMWLSRVPYRGGDDVIEQQVATGYLGPLAVKSGIIYCGNGAMYQGSNLAYLGTYALPHPHQNSPFCRTDVL